MTLKGVHAMSHRRRSYSYNVPPPPSSAPLPAPAPAIPPLQGILSGLFSGKTAAPPALRMPALPVGEILGGVSNTVRGLVLNDNWWVLLLIIFLFFPNISNKMFGGLLKD